MLIDLKNSQYYLSKYFSIGDRINDLFESNREDLTDEEREKASNLNKTIALSTLPTSLGISTYLFGRKQKKVHDDQVLKRNLEPIKEKKLEIPVPITEGKYTKRLGLILSSLGLAGGTTALLMKHRLYKKKDNELGEKSFAVPVTMKRPVMPKMKNAAQLTQAQMAQQRTAQAQQKMQQQNQLEAARTARANQVQGRHNQNFMQRQTLEAGRNNRAQLTKSAKDQTNLIQSRKLAIAQQRNQVNSNIANPKVGPKPIVSVNN